MYFQMELRLIFVLAIAIILVSAVLSKPTALLGDTKPNPDHVEEARQLWNSAKKAHRALNRERRVRKMVPSNEQLEIAALNANMTANKYIIDLYNNLTKTGNGIDGIQQRTQANTIRSLPNIKEPVCGEYNFSIEAINQSEYILKSSLRLFQEASSGTESKRYWVMIKTGKTYDEKELEFVAMKEIQSTNVAGWHEFGVDEGFIANLIKEGQSHAIFKVFIYSTTPTIESTNPESCSTSNIQFVYTIDDEDKLAQLTVYSFDPELEKIDYTAILDNISNDVSGRRRRRRRDITSESVIVPPPPSVIVPPPNCDVHLLNVTSDEIPLRQNVLAPAWYNAGICGGECNRNFPENNVKHSQLIHFLVSRESFALRHENYKFTQCCAPVKYASLQVIVSSAKSGAYINIMNNMRITQCECLDVIDFSPPKRR